MPTIQELLATGAEHHQAGRLREAEIIYRQVLQTQPNDPDALHLLGAIANAAGQRESALDLIGRAVRVSPNVAQFRDSLGKTLFALGRFSQAETAFRNCLKSEAATPERYGNLGDALREQGRYEDAASFYQQAIALDAADVEIWSKFVRLAAYDPEPVRAALSGIDRTLARDAFLRSLEVLARSARVDEYEAVNREARTCVPDDPALEAFHLFRLNFDEETDPASLIRAYKDWWCKHFSQPQTNPDRMAARRCDGTINVAYIGTYLHYMFLRNLLPYHDGERFNIFVLTNDRRDNAMTVNSAVEVRGFEDRDLEAICRECRIHIAVDLCGHLPVKRSMGQFAQLQRRVAPIQCSWVATINTTGGNAIDYIIADSEIVPPSCEDLYTETIARLPDVCHCWIGRDDAPESGPLPATANGYITFGSANRGFKLTDRQMSLWAQIVSRCPESRFRFKGRHCDDPSFVDRAVRCFGNHGIARDRLAFDSESDHPYFMNFYRAIDISLDTFPYNGGITSLESLWMGVPTITLSGRRFVSRVTRGYLAHLGYRSWIAETQEEYVQRASALASDTESLARERSTLRDRMRKSTICDGRKFTRQLEALYVRLCNERGII